MGIIILRAFIMWYNKRCMLKSGPHTMLCDFTQIVKASVYIANLLPFLSLLVYVVWTTTLGDTKIGSEIVPPPLRWYEYTVNGRDQLAATV